MKKPILYIFQIVAALILSLGMSHAQNIDYTFVTVGCNRVDDADSTVNKPSTANVYQLNRLFDEVANLTPTPEYLFFTGDMVIGYNSDTVRLANQLQGWLGLYTASPLFSKSTKLVVIPGNHETQSKPAGKLSYVAAERTFVRVMGNYLLGSNGPTVTGLNAGTDSLITDQSKLTYSFDFKNDHFLILNTDPVGRDWRVPTKWIANDLSSAKGRNVRHIFAFGHKPAYATKFVPADGLVKYPALRNAFWTSMENNNSEAMFSAHNHVWEKQQPNPGKTWQIIAGNGGSNLEPTLTTPGGRYFGYTLVKVFTNNTVIAESYGRDLDPTNYSFAPTTTPNNAFATTLRESVNLTFGIQTGINDNIIAENKLSVVVSPNPVVGSAEVKVNIPAEGESSVKIFDMQGKPSLTIAEKAMNKGVFTFMVNTQSLIPGSYIVTVTNNGIQASQKIIVSK